MAWVFNPFTGTFDYTISTPTPVTPGGSDTQVQYNASGAFGGMSGTSWNNSNQSLTLTSTGSGTGVTTSQPVLNLAQTWNASGVTFTGLQFNATDTASASGSLLLDLQVGGVSAFSVTKGATAQFSVAKLQLGAADAAAPVAQTLQVQSVIAGTTNTAGTNFTIAGSKGTGTGAGGSIIFQVAPAGSSGTAQNAYSTALTIDSAQQSTFAGNLLFGTDNSFDIGTGSASRPRNVYIASGVIMGNSGSFAFGTRAAVSSPATNVVFASNNSLAGGAAFQLQEMTAPAAGATDIVRIYAEDNGSGKTRLMALFATGAAQQIAIEP